MSSVFKYTEYRPEFFNNFFLKASTFGEFNDPFEMVMGDYLSSLRKSDTEEIMSFSHTLSDPAAYYSFAWDAQCGVRASIGVLCFSSKEDNLLMWAHYAKNHEGLCIESDVEPSRLLKTIFNVEPRPPLQENTRKLNRYEALVYQDNWELSEAQKLRRELDIIYADQEPKLLELDLYIENRQCELGLEED